MSSSEMDDDYTDLNEDDDFDLDNFLESSSDDEPVQWNIGYQLSSYIESLAKANTIFWKDDVKQRFMKFFHSQFSSQAAISVEEFAKRHNLGVVLMSDLLDLMMMLFGRTICSSCKNFSISSQTVLLNEESQASTSKNAVPDSTIRDSDTKCEKPAETSTKFQLKRKLDLNGEQPSKKSLGIEKESRNETSDVQLLSTLKSSPADKRPAGETSNTRPAETSDKFKAKRILKVDGKTPSKKMAFEAVMEKRENGHMFCSVCKVSCTSKKSANDHVNGKSHKKNLRKSEMPPKQKKKSRGAATADEGQPMCSQKTVSDNVGQIHCDVCNVYISGEENAKVHYAGKPHKKAKKRNDYFLQKNCMFQPKADSSCTSASKMLNTTQPDTPANESEVEIICSFASVSNVPTTTQVNDSEVVTISQIPNSAQLKLQNVTEENISAIEEITSNENTTQKLRVLYIEGQRNVDNEEDSDCE